jgi:hypothetical protein
MAMAVNNTNNIFVLTYNICWGCMTLSKGDKTGITVVEECIKGSNGNNICIENLNTTIKNIEEHYKQHAINFDFVGLQEATKWEEIAKNKSLNKMEYVHVKKSSADLITFYNQNKFKLNAVQSGTIYTDGRPFIILFLTKIDDNEPYIVINMHNCHGITKPVLEKELSKNGNNGFRVPHSMSNIKDVQTQPLTDISDIIQRKDNNIIAMGDTNDHNNYKYWNGLKLFGNNVMCPNQPPKSCCITSLSSHYTYGDYIMANDKFSFALDNEIPPNGVVIEPISDHKPVIAILTQKKQIAVPRASVASARASSASASVPSASRASASASRASASASRASASASRASASASRASATNNLTTKIAQISVEPQLYKLKDKYLSKILRLQDDKRPPHLFDNINNIPFRGRTITPEDPLYFSNGEPTGNGLVLVQSLGDFGLIGYVKKGYVENKDSIITMTKSRTARLQDNTQDPNDPNLVKNGIGGYPFKGGQIEKGQIKFADNIPTKNGLVLIQVKGNPNKFGYVQQDYLEPIKQKGGNKYRKNKRNTKNKHNKKWSKKQSKKH